MLSSDIILNRRPAAGSILHDKIYLTAHVDCSKSGFYKFIIDKERTPIVKFDNSIPIDAPTRMDMKNTHVYSMFSSNTMIKIDGLGYPITIRSPDAYMSPNHYTCPAGRCDMLPRDTAMSELNEEILLIAKNRTNGELRTLGFGGEKLAQEGKTHKERELSRILPPLLMLETVWLQGKHEYQVEMGSYTDSWEPISDISVLERGNCTVIKDEINNTYELCFAISTNLPNDWVLESISEGENFGNEVVIVDNLFDLPTDKCVPALKGFISMSTHAE